MKIRSFIGIKNNLFFKTNERFKIVNDLSQFIDQSDSYKLFLYRYWTDDFIDEYLKKLSLFYPTNDFQTNDFKTNFKKESSYYWTNDFI